MIVLNPDARLEVLEIEAGREVIVVDDVLRNPEALVSHAVANRHALGVSPHNAYPGLQFPTPPEVRDAITGFFMSHVRSRLGGRRVLHANVRLAMVTTPPLALQARQTIPHRDHQQLDANECIAASVLYLFHDAALGGTAFFRPRRAAADTARLVHDSSTLSAADFAARHGTPTAYFNGSNEWFEHLATVPARWNRMIFYDGAGFHAGSIDAPGKLTDDPASGRLTLNGFFTCTRRAS